MKRTFSEAIANRRSYYSIDDRVDVSKQDIEDVLRTALLLVPSAFNSQTTRMVLLLGQDHKDLWELVLETLRPLVSDEDFVRTRSKIKTSFAAGYGTVLFYEDMSVVESLQGQFPLYADRFPVWAEHTSAMHQFTVWTMLQDKGLGASLQHYNPIIDAHIASRWSISPSWRLIAQMPFGNRLSEPPAKVHQSLDDRLIVFGQK